MASPQAQLGIEIDEEDYMVMHSLCGIDTGADGDNYYQVYVF